VTFRGLGGVGDLLMLGLGGVGDLWTLLGGVGDRVGLGGVGVLCTRRGGVGARATRCGSKSSE
jgi:hypothetical protein